MYTMKGCASMDQTALFTMSYGVYVLGTKLENKLNACIINTGMQVTSIPEQISITVAKTNLTHDMVKASGQFSLTTLSEVSALENVKRFGMQSGRDVNKFDGIDYKVDVLGNPYIEEGAVAVLTGKVTQTVDVGTHTIFIASVIDAKDFKENKPMTYAAYRELKAQSMPPTTKNEKIYECTVCHYEYNGEIPFEELPDDYVCPICKQPKSVFKLK